MFIERRIQHVLLPSSIRVDFCTLMLAFSASVSDKREIRLLCTRKHDDLGGT